MLYESTSTFCLVALSADSVYQDEIVVLLVQLVLLPRIYQYTLRKLCGFISTGCANHADLSVQVLQVLRVWQAGAGPAPTQRERGVTSPADGSDMDAVVATGVAVHLL